MNNATQSKYYCPEDRGVLYEYCLPDGPADYRVILLCECGYQTDDATIFKAPRPLKFAPWHYRECDESRVCICDKIESDGEQQMEMERGN